MGSSRFVPLVIAGFIGLLIGWLLGPDVSDVEEVVTQRMDQYDAKLAALQAPVGALQTGLKSIDERTTQMAAKLEAAGNPGEAVNALGAKIDAVSGAVAVLGTDVAAKIAALPAPAPAAPASGDQVATLAGQIGNSGAVLLAGQSAVFGAKQIALTAVSATSATLQPQGGQSAEVATGASADLGQGCSVTLAGIVGPAAFLKPTGCGAPAAPAAPAAAPAPAPAAAKAPAAAPAPAPAPAAATASAGADGTPLMIGQTATFGEKRVFLSRISAADGSAFLFVVGAGQVEAKSGAKTDLGDGCAVTLAKIDGTTVYLKPEGCGGETAAAAPAAAAKPAAAAAPAAPAPAAAPAAASATASAGGTPLTIGQTATFGDKRIFLSRLTPEAAYVVVVGSGPAEVAKGAAADLGNGCKATLQGIADGAATFAPSGC